jgi:hypothetical protein
MNRLPATALLTIGALLAALSLIGLLNSVHTSAKIVYAILLTTGIASLATGYRKRAATH